MEDKEHIIKIKKECENMLIQMNKLYDQLQNHFAGFLTNFPSNWQFHFLYLKDKYNIDMECPHCENGRRVLKYFSWYNSYYVECDQRSVYNLELKKYQDFCKVADREYLKDSDIVFDTEKLELIKEKVEELKEKKKKEKEEKNKKDGELNDKTN